MQSVLRFFVLALLCLVLDAKQPPARDGAGNGSSGDSANVILSKILPCAKQSWQCGNWEGPLQAWDLTTCVEGRTPEGKGLSLSTCDFCMSIRVIDPDSSKQRVVTSPQAQRQKCEHKWHAGVHTECFDPMRAGDLLLIAYRARLYVLAVEEVFPYLRYRIGTMALTDPLPPVIDLRSLRWQEKLTDNEISIGGRSIPVYTDVPEKALSIVYDNYYGYLGSRPELEDENPAFMAIVHKSDLPDRNVVDLGKFRFKTWEDGLGNLCTPSNEPVTKTVETPTPIVEDTSSTSATKQPRSDSGNAEYLELHRGPIWDVDCPSDGSYIATAGSDGRVVISYLDRAVRTVIGPLDSTSRFFSVGTSRDGRVVIAGGDFDTCRSVLKINLPDATLENISLPLGTGYTTAVSFRKRDGLIACLTSPGQLLIVRDKSTERFTSPTQLHILGRKNDSRPDVVDVTGDTLSGVLSPDCGFCALMCAMKREPVGNDYALIVFDSKGQQTLRHGVEGLDPLGSRAAFLAEDHLVLCLSSGALLEWRFLADSHKWQLQRTLPMATGPFSAALASHDGRSVWLARESTVFEIDVASGMTKRRVVLEVGEAPNEPHLPVAPVPAIVDMVLVPNYNLLAAALRDGRLALISLDR